MANKIGRCVDCEKARFFTGEKGKMCRRACIQRTDLITSVAAMNALKADRVCEYFVEKRGKRNESEML